MPLPKARVIQVLGPEEKAAMRARLDEKLTSSLSQLQRKQGISQNQVNQLRNVILSNFAIEDVRLPGGIAIVFMLIPGVLRFYIGNQVRRVFRRLDKVYQREVFGNAADFIQRMPHKLDEITEEDSLNNEWLLTYLKNIAKKHHILYYRDSIDLVERISEASKEKSERRWQFTIMLMAVILTGLVSQSFFWDWLKIIVTQVSSLY